MNYRSLTIEELDQYSLLVAAVENCKNRIVEIEEKLLQIKTGMREVVVKASTTYEDKLCHYLDVKQEQILLLTSLNARIARFERAMHALPPEEQKILQLCYISKKGNMEDIAWELGMEKSCVYKKKNRALQHFQKALFGTDEN